MQFYENWGHLLKHTWQEGNTATRKSLLTVPVFSSIRPKFRPLPRRVRKVPRPPLSHMFEKISPIFIKLHWHYSVLLGFVAGTTDMRTTYISLHKWSKKKCKLWYRWFLQRDQEKLSNADAILWKLGTFAQTYVTRGFLGPSEPSRVRAWTWVW